MAGALGAATMLIVSACAVGPDRGPGLIAGEHGDEPASTSSAPPPPPTLTAPRQDLSWRECAQTTANRLEVAVPAGVVIECATFSSPVDPAKPDDETITIAATRLRTAQTPANAAPLVLTAGSDMPSTRALLLTARGQGRELLRTHPIVAIDRRGLPQSNPLDCMTRAERAAITDNGLSGGTSQANRITELATSASSASDGCTETLTPYQLDFSIGFAASDLETLRTRWGVEHLGLIGVGEGSDVTLAYASIHGKRVGRLILDTPTPFGATARDRAQSRSTGVQAGLQAFAQRCANLPNCAFGADGVATMKRVIDKGAQGRLRGLSDTQVLSAITTAVALAPDEPGALPAIASAITAADRGDVTALTALADQAADLRLNDGALVSRCNDVIGPVGQNEIPGLIDTWSRQSPLTGSDSALSLMRCNGWAAGEPTAAPQSFVTPPLVLNGSNDTINGGNGASALRATFLNAGVDPVTVTWPGIGYSVLAHSACAAQTVAEYVDRAPLPAPIERGCPA
ncbi:alpha/beta hydrolase [Gordonia sp. NPDC003585]|uniref:alpha/beta hydrolase n=1 Tax=Gordonia sp. NPDC003585 TaxID=3154275 RepID=UPI0033A528EA